MEYLEGHTLDHEIKSRRSLPAADAVAYTRQILSALGAAHAKGIVHRDVKPQNLFLHSPGGASPTIKVLDFGAARDTQAFADPAFALSKAEVGHPLWGPVYQRTLP